jgi:outer membrane protein OmpA-like peptidoglycan-associated protein
MIRKGKCVNFTSCLIAYRGDEISISQGAFVCPECGKPLQTPTASKGINLKIAALVGGAIVLFGLIVVFAIGSLLSRFQKAGQIVDRQTIAATPAPAPSVATASPEPAPKLAATPAPAPVAAVAPDTVVAEAKPNLDATADENRTVKAEVLKRIDLMPTISEENKDKLYMSVDRARQMGRMLVIPFASGSTKMSTADTAKLRDSLHEPAIKTLLDDPTAVFVVLGFADMSGDPKANIKISDTRAQSVITTMREECGVANVMHAVGMGGSQLFDASGKEKNRVVEIWAVLP